MKLGRQGEILLEPKESYLEIVSNPTEINKPEGKEVFKGSVKLQPHFLKDIWDVLEKKRQHVLVRSGGKVLIVKYLPEKDRVRLIFKDENRHSSYILFGSALSRFKDLFLDAVKKLKVIAVREDGFSGVKAGEFVVLKNENKELYLNKDFAEKLKDVIFKNYLIKEPVKMENRWYSIDEEGNLKVKGVVIPKDAVKEVYLFLL